MSRRITSLFLCGLTVFLNAYTLQGQAFPLTDASPTSPDFRERFLGSYGVNSEIEPSIRAEDRPLYEAIAPYLRSDPQRAIREVRAQLTEDSNPAFRFLLGNLYYQINQYENAEQQLLKAVEKFPDFRRAHRTLGLIYIQTEQYAKAIQSWIKVITLGGGDAQSYGLLAYAYLSQQKYQSALSAYEMARMFNPDSRDFRRGEAQSRLQIGQSIQAIALFDELIAEEPQTSDYWLLQANAYLQLSRYEDAIVNLELVHALGGATSETQNLLGDLYLREEQFHLALDHYIQTLKNTDDVNRTLDRTLRPLALFTARGRIDDATAYLTALSPRLENARLTREQSSLIQLARARIALHEENNEVAQSLLETLVKEDPLHPEALRLLAQVYEQGENFEQAEFHLQRLLSIPESKLDALIALGRLEVARGDLETALQHLRLAQQQEPNRAGLARYIESIKAALP